MATELSVADWHKYRNNNLSPSVRPWEYVDIPPLPTGLDYTNPHAVKLYVINLMQSVTQAGLDGSFWEIRNQDGQSEVNCGIRGIKLPDGFEVKGLDEAEIRRMASDRDWHRPYNESLYGNDDQSE